MLKLKAFLSVHLPIITALHYTECFALPKLKQQFWSYNYLNIILLINIYMTIIAYTLCQVLQGYTIETLESYRGSAQSIITYYKTQIFLKLCFQ